ncbi:MAG: adenylyl-sulfate kinase [Actinomycetota bacterium]|nr:adenylyl-sulfate kinase [Actinomycetota bacterium]
MKTATTPPTVSAGSRSWTPGARELADLDLLLRGGYQPLAGFMGRADTESVRRTGRLAGGRPWPVPVTLAVPDRLAGAGPLTLTDAEGAPLAVVQVTESWPAGAGRHFVAGPVTPLGTAEYGSFRRLHLPAAEVRGQLGSSPALAVVATEPLHWRDIAGIRATADLLDARILLVVATGTAGSEPLIRAVMAAAAELAGAVIVAVPLPAAEVAATATGPGRRLAAHVAAAFGGTHLYGTDPIVDAPLPLVAPPADPPDDPALSSAELADLLDRGAPLPPGFTPAGVERELRRARRPRSQRGVVVLFTGLSGSGKSTLARGLHDTLLEGSDRSVTLLDGDVVRQMLSAGLGFSRADRELNVRRIGYVAAEAARHGGVAICAPIAPYADTRADVRALAEAVGDFLLVWVSTPLEECERRDRKGLYARARAGQISGFTGVDDPYEEPADADLVIDTSGRPITECVADVLELMHRRGWVGGPA